MRKIYASRETEEQAKKTPNKIVSVYSFFPIDKSDCACVKLIQEWQKRLGIASIQERKRLLEQTPFITCPRDKTGMTRFQIMCGRCNHRQGYLWATDATLIDWCDFHYTQWTRGDYWRGCFTPHVSPVTEQLCLECCCGNDTRDFRANMTLPQHIAERKERENRIGRHFNQPDSKFIVQPA